MNKEEDYKRVCELIKYNIRAGDCGIFNNRNIVGDDLVNLFKGKYIELDICHDYAYFEVLGLSLEEFNNIKKFYIICVKEVNNERI